MVTLIKIFASYKYKLDYNIYDTHVLINSLNYINGPAVALSKPPASRE